MSETDIREMAIGGTEKKVNVKRQRRLLMQSKDEQNQIIQYSYNKTFLFKQLSLIFALHILVFVLSIYLECV